MSPIGRIFILLNLILSAAFLGWASHAVATNQDFKKKFEAEQVARKADKEELNAQIGELRGTLAEATSSKERARQELELAQADVERFKTGVATAERANEQLRASVTKIEETLGNYNDTIASLEQAKDRAVAEARQAERDRDGALDKKLKAELAQREADERFKDSQDAVAQLEVDLTGTRKELALTSTRLQTLIDMTGSTLESLMAQKQIEATVLSVKSELPPGLVALNVGSKDGVTRGMTFEIYRGTQYKGQVRVENVREAMCSALVVSTVNATTMAQGDSASTRL